MSPPNLSLILIMACFWLTFWLVHKYLVGPVGKALEERKHRVDTAQSTWNSKHEEFLSQTSRLEGEMEDAMREAGQVRAEHRQRALDGREERLREARETAGSRLDQALAELDKDATSARSDLEASAAELARQFASQLLGRKVAS